MNIDPWQIYTLAGVLFVILEAFIPGFVLLPIGIALLITAAFATAVTSTAMQLLILAVSSLTVFLFFHKFVRPKLKKETYQSNVDAMVGKEATVTETVSSTGGYVKLYGDTWKAISQDGKTHDVGSSVTIRKIDGNKVIVD